MEGTINSVGVTSVNGDIGDVIVNSLIDKNSKGKLTFTGGDTRGTVLSDMNSDGTLNSALMITTPEEGTTQAAYNTKTGIKIATFYTDINPPPYPVTSVNGVTGNVNIDRISGGSIITTGASGIHVSNGTDGSSIGFIYVNPNGLLTGYNAAGTIAHDVYCDINPPPYPVTSVNGKTGAITNLLSSVLTSPGTESERADIRLNCGLTNSALMLGVYNTGVPYVWDGTAMRRVYLQRLNEPHVPVCVYASSTALRPDGSTPITLSTSILNARLLFIQPGSKDKTTAMVLVGPFEDNYNYAAFALYHPEKYKQYLLHLYFRFSNGGLSMACTAAEGWSIQTNGAISYEEQYSIGVGKIYAVF